MLVLLTAQYISTFFVTIVIMTSGYNLETRNITVFSGDPGSYFGYTVALQDINGLKK